MWLLWLSTLLLALTATGSRAANAQTAGSTELRVGMVPPRGSPWDRVLRAWSGSLRTATDGALELGVTASVADDATLLSGLSAGTYDIVILSSVGLGELVPMARVLDAPGALGSYDELDRARAALEPDLAAALSAAGASRLGWCDFGEARFFSTARIAAPADLAGRRVWRAPGDGVIEQVLLAVGATGVLGGTASVLPGLTGGSIDTVLATSMAVTGLSWSPRMSYVTRPSAFFVGGATLVRSGTYLGLSDSTRAALDSTAAQAHATLARTIRRDEERYYTALTSTAGYTEVDTTPSAALWEAAYDRARRALVGTHYSQAQLDRVIAAGR